MSFGENLKKYRMLSRLWYPVLDIRNWTVEWVQCVPSTQTLAASESAALSGRGNPFHTLGQHTGQIKTYYSGRSCFNKSLNVVILSRATVLKLSVCDVWTPPKLYNLLITVIIYDINILVMNRDHLLHLALCTRLFWGNLKDKQPAWHAEECKWDFGTSGKVLWYDSRNSALKHIQLLLVPNMAVSYYSFLIQHGYKPFTTVFQNRSTDFPLLS